MSYNYIMVDHNAHDSNVRVLTNNYSMHTIKYTGLFKRIKAILKAKELRRKRDRKR